MTGGAVGMDDGQVPVLSPFPGVEQGGDPGGLRAGGGVPPLAVAGEDGIGFANVVTYYEDDYNGNTPATLRPGYIYQVEQVRVTPVNIDVTTKQTDAYNVYVVVTVVPYTTQPVYPGFE